MPAARASRGLVKWGPRTAHENPGPRPGSAPQITFISVDLPAPLSPTTATDLVRVHVEVDLRERLHVAE